MPYAKSYRIFPFLKFVCFRNMNYVYAKVNLKYIWTCQPVGPQMKPTFPPAGARALLECVEVRNIHFVSSGRHEGPQRL